MTRASRTVPSRSLRWRRRRRGVPFQDRALASLYEPNSLSGFLPWAQHQSSAVFKALLNDADGARGLTAGLVALALLVSLLGFAMWCAWELVLQAYTRIRGMARPRRRAAWLAPTMLCLATSACVGKYDTEPQQQPPATAESIGKEGRYSIMQALSRNGTNRPVPGTFYYLNSPLGSTSVMFDTQGAALLRLEYFPDGTLNNAASQGDYIATHTFGQKEYDKELEAYYNAFRYYDADTMRFTTPDAIKESSDFLVHNIYAYTRNNPVNYTDPTGFITMKHDGGGCPRCYKPRSASMQIDSRTGPRGVWHKPRPKPKPYTPGPHLRSQPRVRTHPYNRGPDGGPPRPPPRSSTSRSATAPNSPVGPYLLHNFPQGAMVPDGIRDADAHPVRRGDPELKRIYNPLVRLLREHGAENMTLSYHAWQAEGNSAVVDTLRSWGIHTDNTFTRDEYEQDYGGFLGNMHRYAGKINLVYSIEGGISVNGGAFDGRSTTVHEAEIAAKNFPIGPGAATTHLTLQESTSAESTCAPVLCSDPGVHFPAPAPTPARPEPGIRGTGCGSDQSACLRPGVNWFPIFF